MVPTLSIEKQKMSIQNNSYIRDKERKAKQDKGKAKDKTKKSGQGGKSRN